MRRTAIAGAAIIGLTVMLAACGGADDAMDDETMDSGSSEQMSDGGTDDGAMDGESMDGESMDGGAEAMGDARSGSLTGEDAMVSGAVTVADGTVELTGYSADGDGLHLYLAAGDDEMAVEGGLDLGELTADADQTFDAMGDTADYTHVAVYAPMDKKVLAVAELM